MNLEAVIERVWRYALGAHDDANLEAIIERVWTGTWRQSMDGSPGAETHSSVNSQPWDCDEVTVPLSSHGELADGGRSCREEHQKLKLHSWVNSST